MFVFLCLIFFCSLFENGILNSDLLLMLASHLEAQSLLGFALAAVEIAAVAELVLCSWVEREQQELKNT